MKERLFTVEEANALIPRLEIIVGKMQRHGLLLREQIAEIASASGRQVEELSTEEIIGARPQLQGIVEELDALLGEIAACGGHLKGLDLGLVDFPALVEGEVVLLCWQYGEKQLRYYHTLEAGFGGRKPLNVGPHARDYLH